MGRLVLLMALLPIVVQGASLEDRAVEAMKLVDISDRAIDDWWKTFTTMWEKYDTKISAQPTLACTDWENLLKELGEIKTQIGLVEDGLKALKAQLVAIREILEHATWGTTSGLHCQKTPEEPICKALKELDDLADEKQKRLDGEKKIVDDEITRIKTYDCNCTWKQWAGDWGKCSKTCEEGIQTEKRTILWNVRNNGVPCNPADATRTAACDEGCCPVDCKWNDWEKWGECPNVCSADTQYRRRVRSKAQTMMCETRGGQRCIGGPNDKEECKILEVWDKRIDGLKEKHAGLQKQIDLYKEKLCDPNPCANGGSCNEGACTCKGDWTGYHCKVNSAPKPKPQPGHRTNVVEVTAKKGWVGSRVHSDGRYFQTDLAKFEEAMGTLVDNMRINILQKDNVGNVKWCGVVMMFTKPSIHGRRDDGTGDVGQWAVGDTIESVPDCHGFSKNAGKFQKVEKKHCADDMYNNQYTKVEEAKRACAGDPNCRGVYDMNCDGLGTYALCPVGHAFEYSTPTYGSCIYEKTG